MSREKKPEPARSNRRQDPVASSDAQWYAHRETRGPSYMHAPSEVYRRRLEVEEVRDVIREIGRWGSY